MPTPNKDESKEKFISRCIPYVMKEGKDKDQATAMCYSIWKDKGKKKEMLPLFPVVKTKESDDDEDSYTFIAASTLPDRVREVLPDGTKIEGEVLSKNVLDKFAGFINDKSKFGGKYGSYRTVSLFHDRVYAGDPLREEAGFVVPGTGKVLELEDYPGNYGLFTKVKVNKMYNPPPEYSDYTPEKIEYKINNYALGLSLEYDNLPEQEKLVQTKEGIYRFIMDSDDFRGFGFARPNVIGNTTAVRVKEIYPQMGDSMTEENNPPEKKEENKEEGEAKIKEQLADANAKVKELQEQLSSTKEDGEKAKLKEQIDGMETKMKELKLQNDETAAKIKESIELAFSGVNFQKPARLAEDDKTAKVKEAYGCVEKKDWVKFKEISDNKIEEHGAKIKEMLSQHGDGFDFEKWQTLKVKCAGSRMIVVPSAKTKDTLDSSDMAESDYYQTNAMFADRYVAGITETFLREDSLLTAMPKEQHIGGNDKYQWRLWKTLDTVTGDSTLSVNPDVTSVATKQYDFEKMETRICEYRQGVEVSDFAQHHSMAAIGDLLNKEIQRAASAVTESMNADLFKPKVDDTTGWYGFNGLIGVADSATYTSMYGKTRSSTNRLLDDTTANTYVSTSEGIEVEKVREGYEKVLAHGSNLADLVILIHPTQSRKLFNSEDAAIRNNILTMAGAPPSWGFNRATIPHLDGIPMIRDYRCESSAAAADMFAVVDLSADKGFNLVVSRPLGIRGLAKVGLSEKAYVNFWGCTVYKAPRNVFVHDSLST